MSEEEDEGAGPGSADRGSHDGSRIARPAPSVAPRLGRPSGDPAAAPAGSRGSAAARSTAPAAATLDAAAPLRRAGTASAALRSTAPAALRSSAPAAPAAPRDASVPLRRSSSASTALRSTAPAAPAAARDASAPLRRSSSASTALRSTAPAPARDASAPLRRASAAPGGRSTAPAAPASARGASRPQRRPSASPSRRGSVAPRGAGAALPMIVMGASTGGVFALELFLRALPAEAPPVLIVQHMPPGFTRRFAARCDEFCAVDVKEAEHGDEPRPGLVLVAAGDHHLRLSQAGQRLVVTLDQEPRVSGHRPSVDVLFESAAQILGPRAVGVLLTGMGRDGAAGLLQMKQAGARTIAQDEATCVVFGMPEAAISLGAVDWVLPMDAIAARALEISARI